MAALSDAVSELEKDFDDIAHELRTMAAEQLRGREQGWSFQRRQGLIAQELIAAANDLGAANPERNRGHPGGQLLSGHAPCRRLGRRQPRPPLPVPLVVVP